MVAVACGTQWGQEQVQVLSLPLSVLRSWHRGAGPRMAWLWCPLWQHLLWVMRRGCAVPWFRAVITSQPAVLGEEKGSGLFSCVLRPCPAQVLLWVWVKPQLLQRGQSRQSPGLGGVDIAVAALLAMARSLASLTLSLRLLHLTASEVSHTQSQHCAVACRALSSPALWPGLSRARVLLSQPQGAARFREFPAIPLWLCQEENGFPLSHWVCSRAVQTMCPCREMVQAVMVMQC